MVWDFAEVNPLVWASGNLGWSGRMGCEGLRTKHAFGQQQRQVQRLQQRIILFPTDSCARLDHRPALLRCRSLRRPFRFLLCLVTACFWQRSSGTFQLAQLSLKTEEIVVDRPHELSNSTHDIAFYERELAKAFAEGRRVLRPDGVGIIVFASKTTASWEAILKAVVDAGWIITGSWPIDTEMEARVSAQGQARLASSVHLVCRPRENPDGSVRTDEVGDWRDVLAELPRRIHEWMPRLAEEGVVGADAIFACLGPALEIFSAATAGSRSPTARPSRSANTWSTSGPPSPTKPSR